MRTFSLLQVNTERQVCCMLGLYQASLKATSPALLCFVLFCFLLLSSCIPGRPRVTLNFWSWVNLPKCWDFRCERSRWPYWCRCWKPGYYAWQAGAVTTLIYTFSSLPWWLAIYCLYHFLSYGAASSVLLQASLLLALDSFTYSGSTVFSLLLLRAWSRHLCYFLNKHKVSNIE